MNSVFKSILSLVFVLFSTVSFGQTSFKSYPLDPNAHAREYSVDMEKMLLDIRFEPEKGKVMGTVSYSFEPIRKMVDSLFLDAPAITFKKVMLNGKECKYKTNKEGITLYFSPALAWNSKHNLSMEYEAIPKKGIYFIGWDDPAGKSRKQIWTQGEGIDNRAWIPGFDDPNDKLITELVVTMDKKYKVLGNGTKIGIQANKDGTQTWHYKMMHPQAFYLIMLGIGEYDIADAKSSSGVALHNWYYPDWKDREEPTYRYTGKIMDFFEKETGVPYPWESYSQIPVQNFLYGAMENTTATIYGDFYHIDKRGFLDKNYIGVNAHEMAHQWFGDFVTARSGKDMWLQESFATFYGTNAEGHVLGDDHYQWGKRNGGNTALNASKDNRNPIVNTAAGTARIYPKGAFVLDMLRYVVGKEEFDKTVTAYLKKHAYGTVETYDFYIAFHDVLGRNLDWFFDEWLYRGGEPEYKVSYAQDINYTTLIDVSQVHERNEVVGLFKMPINVEVHYKDGSFEMKQEMVEEEQHTYRIANPAHKEIDYVLFDPNSKILKKVTFEKPFEMLQAQAMKANNMLDRYDALLALKDINIEKKRNILTEMYRKESFHAMKSEVLSQLAGDENNMSKQIFHEAMNDKDARVRLSAVQNTKVISNEVLPEFEKLLSDSSYKIVETTLNKLCKDIPEKADKNLRNPEKYLKITDNQFGPDNSLRISWLKLKYFNETQRISHLVAPTREDMDMPLPPTAAGALRELVDFASVSFEFRTRVAAMQALQALNYADDKAIENILNAYLSKNSRLSGPAGDVITYFRTQEGMKMRFTNYVRGKKWQDADKEMIEKQFGKI